MSFVATAIIASGVIGAGASIYGATKAAGAQSQALSTAAQIAQQGRSGALGALQHTLGPYSQLGDTLRPTLTSLLTPGPSQTQTLQQLPGFQFIRDMTDWGISAGAGQTGISGTTAVKGGELAGQLGASYWSDLINQISNTYGQGQNAATHLAQGSADVYTGSANNLAQLAVGQGNVQAGLYGAIGGAVGNVGSSLANAALISKLTGGLNGPQQAAAIPSPNTFYPNATTGFY